MQCACAMLSSVACPALQIVFTLSHKRHDFRKKVYWTWNVFWFSVQLFLKYISKKKWARYDKNVFWSSCKIPVIVVPFQWNLNVVDIFSHFANTRESGRSLIGHEKRGIILFQWNLNVVDIFSKNTEVSNFVKIHSPGAVLFLADLTKLIIAFHNFANALESVPSLRGHEKWKIIHRNALLYRKLR